MKPKNEEAPKLRCLEAIGPWPFITRRHYEKMDHSRTVWHSRHHRKSLLLRASGEADGLVTTLSACLWMPRQLNWWIGTVFAVGSLLFALASVLSLAPPLARAWSLDSTAINAIFFAGSIPFTIAAYLQLYQAANAGESPGDELREKGSGLFSRHGPKSTSQKRDLTPFLRLFGWRPHNIGWLSSALQFVGTILFNINTFDAMLPSLDWLQQDLEIWAPDFVGSVLFLASGYLAFIETCHAHWAWKPSSVSWWVVFTNLLGCVGFMISALFAIVLPGATNTVAVTLCIAFTLLGALCFLVGSLLMLPEAIFPGEP